MPAIDQFGHALARRQLAGLVLLLDLRGAAAQAQFLFQILQLRHQPAHVICRCSHFVYSIGHAGAEMLGVDQRVLKIVWTVFLFALAVALIYAIRDALITFTLAIFLALLLSPLVTIVDHFTSVRVPRTVALTVVYVLMIAAFAARSHGHRFRGCGRRALSLRAAAGRPAQRSARRSSSACLARSGARTAGLLDARPARPTRQ